MIRPARKRSSGKCFLRGAPLESLSGIAMIARDRSTMRARCETRTDRKDATAPSRKAGAAACEMTSENWSDVSISFSISPLLLLMCPLVQLYGLLPLSHIETSLTDLRIGCYI